MISERKSARNLFIEWSFKARFIAKNSISKLKRFYGQVSFLGIGRPIDLIRLANPWTSVYIYINRIVVLSLPSRTICLVNHEVIGTSAKYRYYSNWPSPSFLLKRNLKRNFGSWNEIWSEIIEIETKFFSLQNEAISLQKEKLAFYRNFLITGNETETK